MPQEISLSTQPYKGTRDFYPEDQAIQNAMFDVLKQVARSFGFQEINGPMLEPFELYAAKTGEEIVNEQLYWFIDRGDRKLAMRPEFTPTLARMVAAKINELPKPIRFFGIPNLWRYERPQRGRLREHWQLNVDILGGDESFADAEIIQLGLGIIEKFGGLKHVKARVNHRGLTNQFFCDGLGFSSEKAQKASRLIDARSKMKPQAYQEALKGIPATGSEIAKLEEFFSMGLQDVLQSYSGKPATALSQVIQIVGEAGFAEQIVYDPTVMRGLDYYTGVVFELYDISPENPRAMFGGGRYDDLVGLFGKQALSGVGLGFGDVTLRNFLEVHDLLPKVDVGPDVFLTLPKIEMQKTHLAIAKKLRDKGLRVVSALGVEGFGAQLKQASRLGAKFVVLFGDSEWARGFVLVKELATGKQVEVRESALGEFFQKG